jgi:hypothetical protein
MILRFGLLLLLFLSLAGCRRALEHPEASDPVYRDLKREANKAYGIYKEKEKKTLDAKKAFDEAPIRTGQRLDAQDDYFANLHEQEKYAEKYRYLALKAEMRQKRDAAIYPQIFKDKKPWPDPEQYQEYEVEKRLANAPKEWDPNNRIKQRQLASEAKRKAAESAAGEE